MRTSGTSVSVDQPAFGDSAASSGSADIMAGARGACSDVTLRKRKRELRRKRTMAQDARDSVERLREVRGKSARLFVEFSAAAWANDRER